MSAATKVDTVVIGAGVVGLAVARALSGEILLLDRAANIGTETSSRNSEVVHAGLYYPNDSLKTRFCVQGKHQLYEYCESRGISYRKCGKLVVATDVVHRAFLEKLKQQAEGNGVTETEILSAEEVIEREPALKGARNLQGALWSPSTGIVDSHNFMLNLLADAEQDGSTTLALHTCVDDAKIDTSFGDTRIHLHASGMWLSCRRVINCAGLWADRIASRIHAETTWKPPRQYFAKGTYFRLQQSSSASLFSHLIYPVPDPRGGLGVHATIDLQGQVRFGPDVEWLPVDSDPDAIEMKPDPGRAESFYTSVRTYWPDLKDDSLVPDYTGIRPKLQHPSLFKDKPMPFQDFLLVGPERHGIPGLIHLFGIESPGLTSSMAIANYVATVLDKEK